MKRRSVACGILFLSIMAPVLLWGRPGHAGQRQFSILGNQRDSFFAQFSTGTEKVPVPADPLPVAISTASLYELLLPTTTATTRAGQEFINFLEEKDLFYTKERWIRMRDALESGRTPGEEEVVISSIVSPAPPPLPPGLAIELPYESQLSISGRKLIGVGFKSTIYDKPEPQKRVNSSSFDMTQELQVRIKGRVGKKINVNVDFDDTSQDKRDISVVYKGDPDEVIQEAAFGDITMSLPSTEFVGYSRQLFGVKVDAKYRNLHSWGFFSRTKGFSEIKRFTGNTKLNRLVIPDTSYIGFKYYLAKFGADTIRNGTVKIFRDDRNPNNNNINTSTNTLVESLTTPAVTYTGDFDLLVPGQDYTVDYDRGIVAFRNRLPANYVIAVEYQRADGTFLSQTGTVPGTAKIIKDEANSSAVSRELKTFYSLGNVKIIRDSGRGNFILQMQDLNGNTPASIRPGQSVPSYPQDINVDFEAGIFNFEPPTTPPFPDDLYTVGTHRYNILTEYRYRVKFITLRPGIVPQSERVTMDGKILKANEDYFIDYDAGILTFFNEERINENTVIEVSYDYAPFGGTGGATLVGFRSELSLTNNIFFGSSFIYSFDARTQTVPDIRTTPSSLMVWEGDSRIQNVKLPLLPVTMSLGGEYAVSQQNPNIMNKAIIESMEGINQEDMASVFADSWRPATNPSGERYFLEDISWSNEEVPRKEINPNLTTLTDDKQQVLDISYNLSRSRELSIVQSLSNIGADYSSKLYIETWIYGDGQGEELGIAYGNFNEDVDSDGVLGTEDVNRDGTLNSGEDNGWPFLNPDGTTARFGAGNGKVDSEDLDNDGTLKRFDVIAAPGPYGAINGKTITDVDGNSYSAVTWTGWKLFRIPLNIALPDDWKAIKQVRLTVRGSSAQKGTIKIATLSTTGNKWQQARASVAGSTLTISAINNELNPNYVSLLPNPDYQDLYEIQAGADLSDRKEQALDLRYEISGSTVVELGSKLVYGRPYDLSNYKTLKLFVYGNGHSEDVFFIQAGSDNNYFEYAVPVYWIGWRLITIPQIDLNGDGKPDQWGVDSTLATSRVVGAPSLQNISQFIVGVRALGPKTGELWVNELHAADSWTKDGYAWRLNADFSTPGWATFGGKRKQNNRNFQTFSAGVYNRDYLEDSAYFNISRLPFMPITTSLNRTLTITPSVVQTQGDLVSLLEEGRVVTYSGSGSASLNIGRLPRLGFQFNRSIIDSQQIRRLEDRETTSGSLDYSNPLRFALFPTGITGNYSITNSFFRPWERVSTQKTDSNEFLGIEALKDYLEIQEYQTLEVSETWGGRTPFKFWEGFTLTPNYNLNTVREKNNYFAPQLEFMKSQSQDSGATSSLKIFNWLQPNVNYNITIRENYNITYNTTTVPVVFPSRRKYIERNSSGEISWNFQVRDVINNRFIQSLGFSSSYRAQDSDSYDNVDSSFTAIGLDKLWVRNSPLLDPLPQGTTAGYVIKSIVRKDDLRVAGRYNPFEALDIGGRLSPIRTLSTNFTYTGSEEHSFITGTQRDVYTRVWPDLIFGFNQVEKMLWIERWMSDSQLNVRHQRRASETVNVSFSESKSFGSDFRFNLLRKLDLNFGINTAGSSDFDLTKNLLTQEGSDLSWSGQGGFNIKTWRFTLRYENSQNWRKDGTGKLTQQLFTNTFTGQFNSDMSFPRGLPLPFINRTLPLTNRLIFNSSLQYISRSSPLNVERDNTDTYGLNSSAEYEVSQNFRLSFGLGWSRIQNRVKSDESYQTIEASSRLTIQF